MNPLGYLELDENKTPVPADATLTLNAAGITALHNLITRDILDELEHDYRQMTTTPEEKNTAMLPGIIALARAAGILSSEALDAFNNRDGRNTDELRPISADMVTVACDFITGPGDVSTLTVAAKRNACLGAAVGGAHQ